MLIIFWREIVIGLLLIASGTTLYFKQQGEKLFVAEKAALEAKLTLSQSSVESLQAALSEQNQKIDVFKQEADAKLAKAAQSLAAAKIVQNKTKKQSQQILASTIPQGFTACDAANDLITKQLQ